MSETSELEASGAGEVLLIAGDSHVKSFGIPLKSEDDSHYVLELKQHGEGVLGLVGAWPRQFDAYWAAAQQHGRGGTIAVMWGGNTHLALYLFAPTPLFDIVISSYPDFPLDESVVIVPEEAIRAILGPPVEQLKCTILALKSSAKNILVPGTPAPKEDDDFIRSRFRTEPHFVKVAANMGLDPTKVPLSPPLLRLKLWIILQDLLREAAEETGATFVPVPRSTQTEAGFLHRSCYADDVTHANLAFGDLMLGELRKFTAPREVSPEPRQTEPR